MMASYSKNLISPEYFRMGLKALLRKFYMKDKMKQMSYEHLLQACDANEEWY